MTNLKEILAHAALDYITDDIRIVGIGTGRTANCFIQQLARIKHRIDACVASSNTSAERLRAHGIPVVDLNVVDEVPIYVDGADEVNDRKEMIKGGGGALTREKIIASVAKRFICMVEERKCVSQLGGFPIAIEVIPMARSFVARELVKLGGDPQYRQNFVTDNGNHILDVYGLTLEGCLQEYSQYLSFPRNTAENSAAKSIEIILNGIPGVVDNGLFIQRRADVVLIVSLHGEVRVI